MEVRSCKTCGKIFNYLGASTPYCPSCMKKLEERFTVCKQYILDNPGANIQQVSDETEVSIRTIKQWVREERLAFAEGSVVGIECESCGANILTGRYCDKCKSQLNNSIREITKKPKVESAQEKQKREQAKMRFLDN